MNCNSLPKHFFTWILWIVQVKVVWWSPYKDGSGRGNSAGWTSSPLYLILGTSSTLYFPMLNLPGARKRVCWPLGERQLSSSSHLLQIYTWLARMSSAGIILKKSWNIFTNVLWLISTMISHRLFLMAKWNCRMRFVLALPLWPIWR